MRGLKILFLSSGSLGVLFMLVNAFFFFQKNDRNHLKFEIKPHKPLFGLKKLGTIEILPLANELFIKFQGNVNKQHNGTDKLILIFIEKEEEISKVTLELLKQKIMINLWLEKKDKIYPYLKEFIKKYPILWNSNLKLNLLFKKQPIPLHKMIDFIFQFSKEKYILHFHSMDKIQFHSNQTTDYSIFKRLSF
jgi:hypothetical protein